MTVPVPHVPLEEHRCRCPECREIERLARLAERAKDKR